MKTKLLMERLDAIERQALETLKEVRAMREEMKASPRPSPKGKGEKPCEMKQTRHPADGLNDCSSAVAVSHSKSIMNEQHNPLITQLQFCSFVLDSSTTPIGT